MPYLVLMDGATQGRQIPLASGITRIGRVDGNDVVIDNPSVSSAHAELHISPAGCTLRDLKSTNGTRVNGQPITETALFCDDTLMFGDMTAVFTGADAPSRPVAAPAADVVSVLGTRPTVVVASAVNGQHTTAVCPPDFRKKRDMRLVWLCVVVVLLLLIAWAAHHFITMLPS